MDLIPLWYRECAGAGTLPLTALEVWWWSGCAVRGAALLRWD